MTLLARSFGAFAPSACAIGPLWKENHVSQTGTRVDMKLEVDIIPVSDAERSKQFYQRLGWRFDDDSAPANDVRIVQFTPRGPGSRSARE